MHPELARWANFLLLAFVAPSLEEYVFRGQILGRLQNWRFGFWPAAIVTSVAFALVYAPVFGATSVVMFPIGMVLAWLYRRTKKLWPCIAAHSAYNMVPALFGLIFLR